MKYKLQSVIPCLLVLLVSGTVSKRASRKTENILTEEQKRSLAKIQVAAREGGLPEPEWKEITKYNEEFCYDEPCLSAALEIMEATNFTVDPCKKDMWLDFACSRRVNGVVNINQLETLMGKVKRQTKDLLEGNLPVGKKTDTFLLPEAQVYYQQCKDKKRNDTETVQDMLSYLKENYGEWPILSNRDPGNKFNWLNMVADLNRIERVGFTPALLHVVVDTSTPAVQLRVGKSSFPATSEDLKKMFSRVQDSTGKKRPVRIDQLQGTNNFLSAVSAATLILPENMTFTIGELQEMTDETFKERGIKNIKVNWLEFFQRVLSGSDIPVTSEKPFIHLPFNQVMAVLESVNNHSGNAVGIRSVANALNFQLASLLTQETTDLLNDLHSFKCTDEAGSRDDICYARTTEIFGYSLGKTYLSVFYNKEIDTPAIHDLMKKIQQGYIDTIKTLIKENKTILFLEDKINSMKTFVAEPDWTRKPENLRKFYAELNASKDPKSSYLRNYLAVTNWQVEKKRAWANRLAGITSLSQITIYDVEWTRYLGNVQAQFHKGINEARIEGGIVQAPLFDVGYPGFMNFGGLGMVLAHEIGHGLDTQGRTFNKHGDNSKEWWDPESVKKYNAWVEKILATYGSEAHQVSETSAETIDAKKTINEDIADILGVYMSYFSYQTHLKKLKDEGKKEKILPGLQNFSPQKLFFMKYTNMWCDKKDVQGNFEDLLADHSSGNTRATMPLKGSEEFAHTFDCKKVRYKKVEMRM